MFVIPGSSLWHDDVHNANIFRTVANREDRRAMAKGKPSKGTGRDKRLKRNRGKKKRRR
jgi:hypothetical protein